MFIKPIEGDLYGYWSGSSTCTFHIPVANGAIICVGQVDPLSCVARRYDVAYCLLDHGIEHRILFGLSNVESAI